MQEPESSGSGAHLVVIAARNERTREPIYLVGSHQNGSWRLQAFDDKGNWLENFETAELESILTAPAKHEDRGDLPRVELSRATLALRSLWRDDDGVETHKSDEKVLLDQLIREAFLHESFLLTNGAEGEEASYSDQEGSFKRRFILPAEPWAASWDVGLDFRGVDFSGAVLAGAGLSSCKLQGANFTRCNLRKANLSNLDLTGCNFEGADLTQADVRETRNLVLNRTTIRDTHFSPKRLWIGHRFGALRFFLRRLKAHLGLTRPPTQGELPVVPNQDEWSALRRAYSGPMLTFHFVFMAIYFAPLALSALFWKEVNRAQLLLEQVATGLGIEILTPCLAPACSAPIPIGLAVLGAREGTSEIALGALLLLYNAIRGFLTLQVSRLREDEERTKVSPAISEYRLHAVLHRLGTGLLLPVLGYVLFRTWQLLISTTVQLPAL